MYQFSKASLRNMRGVNEQLVSVFLEAIKVSPIDFGVPSTGGVRSEQQQHGLFLDGKSKCDGINSISNHQKGTALDFYAFVGSASWDKVHLAMVASCILTTAANMKKQGKIDIDLKWGGTFGSDMFNGWDYPHMEITT